jgi:hypothetical protein
MKVVIAREAKQSRAGLQILDRFGAALLAMTLSRYLTAEPIP